MTRSFTFNSISVLFVPSTETNGKLKMQIDCKFILKFLIVCGFVKGFANQKIVENKSGNICGFHNGHRKYIELGENAKVKATNITIPKVKNQT